ncbi:CPBP family intramembrane glutamic endopeptidase [Bacillus solitudinis]|uniref:CPBP family intramembrane glutamic endopeptidase n=1 Tax=Bacillus solitudinis TaxID=2014074 RepID=UPI000C23C92C|nr:type II CAAX endopeptidase family protein [Bacillus solitudinis]
MINTRSFWFGLLLAALLLALSFKWQPLGFWIIFPLSLAILSLYAISFTKMEIRLLSKKEWGLAVISGTLLYLLFAVGNWLIELTGLPLLSQLRELYELVQPKSILHFIWLFLIIIPGEEWFWRGFIVKKLTERAQPLKASIIGTCLYAGVHLFSGSLLLVLAALFAGFIWSYLYARTKNLAIVIVSHLVFDCLLLLVFPLL